MSRLWLPADGSFFVYLTICYLLSNFNIPYGMVLTIWREKWA